jgi:hypothetical protein
MKHDISRNTFDPARHFSRLLKQQGRVDLDADWNEQTSILLHYLRTLATDLIGPDGGPAEQCGFEIIDAALAKKLGRKEDESKTAGFFIGPGRYYVDGLLCENEKAVAYAAQPDYPAVSLEELHGLSKNQLVYLDVWERVITAAEDDSIREVALGGPDTATRAKVVWQVKLKPSEAKDRAGAVSDLAKETKRVLPLLRAQLEPKPDSGDACILSPDSRYRGAENQLYRIEIHRVGKGGATATFKWSRENGSVVFPVLNAVPDPAAQRTTVSLAHLGRDAHLGLAEGDWVELVDDGLVNLGQAGSLLRVHSIEPEEFRVILTGIADTQLDPDKHLLLRRWDQQEKEGVKLQDGAVTLTAVAKPANEWVELEFGVQVQFQLPKDGQFRTGDYWLIPTRTAGDNGTIEWPDEVDGTAKQALPPRGIVHHYAPLAILSAAAGAITIVADCRHGFGPMEKAKTIVSPVPAAAPDRLE